METVGGLSLQSVCFISSRDLMNEKLMTACLVLCVLAVLSPLMLIQSVKVGFIDRLRTEFVEDPSFREIRPANADLRQAGDVFALKKLPGVAFVMPSVMFVPREVDILYDVGEKNKTQEAKLWPSDSNDPLLVRLEGEPPSGDSVVLTKDLAENMSIGIGGKLRLQTSRVEKDKRKKVEIEVTVAGTIPASILPQPTILADPIMDRQIEDFRAGVAVPERTWPGFKSVPAQSFRRLAFVLDDTPGEVLISNLKIRLGISGLTEANPELIYNATGYIISQAVHDKKVFLAERPDRAFSISDLREAEDVFKNELAKVFGLNPPLKIEVKGKIIKLIGADPDFLHLPPSIRPNWMIRPDARLALNDSIWLSGVDQELSEPVGAKIDGMIRLPDNSVTKTIDVPMRLGGMVSKSLPFSIGAGAIEVLKSRSEEIPLGLEEDEFAFASSSFLAMIYRGEKLPLAYDAAAHSFVERSSGYRGFRLVASDIDSVPALVELLEAEGLKVKARSDEIEKLQRLERSLDLLILVVGLVGVSGGLAILASSFFANVQRKRVDYANLRLMGMQKRHVFQIPVVQALIVAVLGLVAAISAYLFVAWILNTMVASQLGVEGQLAKLHVRHYVILVVAVVSGASLSALAASREATRIDPAQALRSG